MKTPYCTWSLRHQPQPSKTLRKPESLEMRKSSPLAATMLFNMVFPLQVCKVCIFFMSVVHSLPSRSPRLTQACQRCYTHSLRPCCQMRRWDSPPGHCYDPTVARWSWQGACCLLVEWTSWLWEISAIANYRGTLCHRGQASREFLFPSRCWWTESHFSSHSYPCASDLPLHSRYKAIAGEGSSRWASYTGTVGRCGS